MAATQEELRIIAKLVDQTIKPLGDIQKRLGKTEKAGKKAGDGIRKSFSKLSSVLTGNLIGSVAKLAGAFAAFSVIKSSISDAREFSTAMSEVATIVDLTKVNMSAMQKEVLRIAKANGENESIVARGLYQAISSGAEAGADATNLLATASTLAVAGLTDTSTSVDLLTSSINAYRSSNLTAQKASDILFRTVKDGKTTIRELGGTLGSVLPIASSLGVSFTEVNAALATMTLGGLSTDEAATALRSTLNSMLTVSTEGEKTLAKFGLSFDPVSLKANGLANTLLEVQRKLSGNTEAIQTLFPNVRALTGVLSLLNDGGVKFKQILDDLAVAAGSTGEAFKTRMLDPAFRLQKLLNEIRITFVQGIGGAALQAFKNIEKQAGSFKKILGDMKVLAAALGGATQAALELVGQLLTKVADFIEQIGGVDAVSKRIKQTMLLLGKVAEAIVVAIIEGINGFIALIQSLPDIFRAIRNEMKLFSRDAEDTQAALDKINKSIGKAVLTLNDPESSGFARTLARADLGEFLKRKVELEAELKDVGGASTESLLQGIAEKLAAPGERLQAAFADFGKQIEAIMSPIAEDKGKTIGEKAGRAFAQSLIDAIRKFETARVFRQALARITPPAGDTSTPPASPGPVIPNKAGPKGTPFVDAIKAAGNSIAAVTARAEALKAKLREVAEQNKQLFGTLKSFASGFGNAIGQWVGGFQSAKQAMADFARRSIAQIAQMIAQAALLKLIIAGLGGPGSQLGGAFAQAVGFSHGGVPGDNAAAARAGIPSAATGSVPGSGRRLVQINEGPFRKEGILPLASARMGGRNVLGVAAAGGGGGGTQNTFVINAVDARSFVDLASGSPQELASIIIAAAQANPQIAAALGTGSTI